MARAFWSQRQKLWFRCSALFHLLSPLLISPLFPASRRRNWEPAQASSLIGGGQAFCSSDGKVTNATGVFRFSFFFDSVLAGCMC